MRKSLILILTLALMLSFAACGGGEALAPVQMQPQELYTRLGQEVQIPAMLSLNEGMMLDLCGIQKADVTRAVVAICEDSLRTDEIWMVEAADEAAAQRITELAKKRLTKKGEESITYSPEQYAVVEKALLLQNGNFVILLVSPDAEAMLSAVKTATGTDFNKMN